MDSPLRRIARAETGGEMLCEAVTTGADLLTVIALGAPPEQPAKSKSPHTPARTGLTTLMAGLLADLSRWCPERSSTPEGCCRSSDEALPFWQGVGGLYPGRIRQSEHRCDATGKTPCSPPTELPTTHGRSDAPMRNEASSLSRILRGCHRHRAGGHVFRNGILCGHPLTGVGRFPNPGWRPRVPCHARAPPLLPRA